MAWVHATVVSPCRPCAALPRWHPLFCLSAQDRGAAGVSLLARPPVWGRRMRAAFRGPSVGTLRLQVRWRRRPGLSLERTPACRHDVPSRNIPCHPTTCHAMPCHAHAHAAPRHTPGPSHAMPCHAMPCHPLLQGGLRGGGQHHPHPGQGELQPAIDRCHSAMNPNLPCWANIGRRHGPRGCMAWHGMAFTRLTCSSKTKHAS